MEVEVGEMNHRYGLELQDSREGIEGSTGAERVGPELIPKKQKMDLPLSYISRQGG